MDGVRSMAKGWLDELHLGEQVKRRRQNRWIEIRLSASDDIRQGVGIQAGRRVATTTTPKFGQAPVQEGPQCSKYTN